MKVDHKNTAHGEVKFIKLFKFWNDEYVYFYQTFCDGDKMPREIGQWKIYPFSKLIYKNK